MRFAYYKDRGVKVNVIASSYFAENDNVLLLKDMREKYLSQFSSNKSVKIVAFVKLCEGILSAKYSKNSENLTDLYIVVKYP